MTPSQLAENGECAWENVSPEYIDLVRDTFKQSTETLESFDITFQVHAPDHSEHWIRMSGVPERLSDGGTLWFGQMENITAQYIADEAQKQKSALLEVMFENLPDHIYYKDVNGCILGVNAASCKYHGRTAEEMIGKTDLELNPDSDTVKALATQEQNLMAEGRITRDQERHVHPDGSIIYLESVKSPLLSHSGRVIGMAGISRDITQQVENEEALVQAKQEAEHNAAFLRAIFDNMEDQFYCKDRESRVLTGNPAWVKSRGAQSIDELIGKTDIDFQPEPLGRQLYDGEQELMKTGNVVRFRERHDLADGRVAYIESIKCPLRNQAGEITGLAGISRDVTEQVENELRITEARQEAENANKAKSAFLAMMSHEIRTPMNGVIGAASLLIGTELSQQQEEFVRTIQVSGENLLTIINDILDYSKIEAGKTELESAPFNLQSCVEDAFDLFIQAAAKKHIELIYYVDPAVPSALLGDSTRLRQILVNLLGNAIKFTEEGEITLKVSNLMMDKVNGTCTLQFAVRDSGIGISEEHKSRLFQAFTQADASSTRKYGGTGLGLSISKKLTKLMGGKIWVESEIDSGSTFYFTVNLPISDCAGDRKAEGLPVEALRGKHVLVVDDNETNRWLLSELLAQWGMTAGVFERPDMALEHLKKAAHYDLALIDYQMPDMDGVELAKQMYGLDRNSRLPVIILSSSYEHIPKSPAIYGSLSKPVRMGKLCTLMLEALAIKGIETVRGKEGADAHVQSGKTRGMRILVAEDNVINQRIIQLMLVRLGCENTSIVADGEEAVAAAMDTPYDLILMDVQMPKMSGLDATRKIREFTGASNRPWIIALTAGVMEEEQTAAREAGMNAFMAKPISVDQLEEALDSFKG